MYEYCVYVYIYIYIVHPQSHQDVQLVAGVTTASQVRSPDPHVAVIQQVHLAGIPSRPPGGGTEFWILWGEGWANQISMDWFKGKSKGNHGFYHQI